MVHTTHQIISICTQGESLLQPPFRAIVGTLTLIDLPSLFYYIAGLFLSQTFVAMDELCPVFILILFFMLQFVIFHYLHLIYLSISV